MDPIPVAAKCKVDAYPKRTQDPGLEVGDALGDHGGVIDEKLKYGGSMVM